MLEPKLVHQLEAHLNPQLEAELQHHQFNASVKAQATALAGAPAASLPSFPAIPQLDIWLKPQLYRLQ